ncbi:MAG: preprotein translocase subunit SecE [Candidatus Accumulibacter sp.]|jgi:preprotein translocase subunit SecE|nr:preprotein translocase subunit SecE [Accumulibacter sp.]
MADKVKFVLALLLLAAGVVGFYLLAEQAMILRVLAVFAGVGLCVAVAWRTESGRRFFGFAKEAAAEARKVVWPTRKETLQMTIYVFGFVIVMAIFLYLADKGLEWVLYDKILGWRSL